MVELESTCLELNLVSVMITTSTLYDPISAHSCSIAWGFVNAAALKTYKDGRLSRWGTALRLTGFILFGIGSHGICMILCVLLFWCLHLRPGMATRYSFNRETTVRVQPITVWYDDESRLLCRRSRALEKKYQRTGLASDRTLWVQQEKTRHKANHVKENSYWLGQISGNTLVDLVSYGRPSHPSWVWIVWRWIGSPSAQDLLEYFVQKIETIRMATGGTPATTKLSPSVNIFSNFEIFSTEDVRKLIMATRSKSCSLDPIPTEIL